MEAIRIRTIDYLEYHFEQHCFHHRSKDSNQVANTFGWKTIAENLDEQIARYFTLCVSQGRIKFKNVNQVKQALSAFRKSFSENQKEEINMLCNFLDCAESMEQIETAQSGLANYIKL